MEVHDTAVVNEYWRVVTVIQVPEYKNDILRSSFSVDEQH